MKLGPGEIKCYQCKGTGYELEINDYPYGYRIHPPCSKCNGDGKLDWIENIVGKKIPNPTMNGVTWLPSSTVKPKNAQVGQAYIDSNSDECYIYDGTVWVHAVSMSTSL